MFSVFRIITIITFTVVAAITFTACESEPVFLTDNPNQSSSSSSGAMSAKVDGSAWEATTYGANIISGVLGILGTTPSGESITISLTESEPGVYTLDENSLHAAAYVGFSGAVAHTSNAISAVGGTAEITAINFDEGWITGTFSFSAYRFTDNTTVEITEGQFTKIPLTSALPPSNNDDDTFTAKVDGQLWTPTTVGGFVQGNGIIDKLTVSGTNNATGETVGIFMPDDITVGTYDFGPLVHLGQYSINITTLFSSDSGDLVITKHDTQNKLIEGTFNFEASIFGTNDNVSITEGAFSVTYQ